MENTPINLNLTEQQFQNILLQEMTYIIKTEYAVDIAQNNENFTSEEMDKIVTAVSDIYKKISASLILKPEQKTAVNSKSQSGAFLILTERECPGRMI